MGGLIVRQFLLRNRDAYADKVPLVLFFATPTAGAERANLASRLTTCRQVDDLRTVDRNSYLLAQRSDWISSGLSKSIVSYCAFEIVAPTVSRDSASFLCSNDPVALQTTHSDAVKPDTQGSMPHVALRSAIRDLLSARTKRASDPDGGALFLDCRTGLMPSVIPPTGRIYVWVTNPLPAESGGGGLAEYFGTPGGDWKWNNAKEPEWSYRCELSNYTQQVALNVEIAMRVAFYEPVAVADQPNAYRHGKVGVHRDWLIVIPKIDIGPQQPFVFFIWNCCVQSFVTVSAPPVATAESPGAASRRELPLRQSTGNLFNSLSPRPWPSRKQGGLNTTRQSQTRQRNEG